MIKRQFRAMMAGLQRSIKGKIPIGHPSLTWLVEHAAYVRNARIVGLDGKTANQRARGSVGTVSYFAVGELCRYKTRSQESGIGQSESRWGAGIWLGVDRRTGQYVIYDKGHGGVKFARTIKAMPQGEQWSLERLSEVDVTPWSMHSAPAPRIEPQPEKEPEQVGRKPVARRTYIKQSDLDSHGYTEHCPRCDHIREGRPGKPPNHSEPCRLRLMQAIAKTPRGCCEDSSQ